jgi:microcystin-dependent protein
MNAITFTQNGTTTNTMNTLSGLTNATTLMYVGMALEGAGIPTGTTVASIIDNNNITMSQNATASATVPVQFFLWGNGDGSTTFNIPTTARRVTMGAGGTGTGTIGNIAGQNGGSETNTLSMNNLPATPPTLKIKGNTTTGTAIDITTSGKYDDRTDFAENLGSATAFNIVQPANIMNRIIKF